MSSDRPPPTFTEAELPAITPLEFIVTPGEDGLSTTTLDVRESDQSRIRRWFQDDRRHRWQSGE